MPDEKTVTKLNLISFDGRIYRETDGHLSVYVCGCDSPAAIVSKESATGFLDKLGGYK
jgi:hypothetical protein